MRHVHLDLTDGTAPVISVDGVNVAPYAARLVIDAAAQKTPVAHIEVSAAMLTGDLPAEVRTMLEGASVGDPQAEAEAIRADLVREIRELNPEQIQSDALALMDNLADGPGKAWIQAIAEALT
jgi:hypothetical protein